MPKDNTVTITDERPLSSSSSVCSTSNSEVRNSEGVLANRRLSDSSAFSVGSSNILQSRLNAFNAIRRSTISNIPSESKRISMPPPRPAPTCAPPPAPGQAPVVTKVNGNVPRRSFHGSFSPKSLRFSLKSSAKQRAYVSRRWCSISPQDRWRCGRCIQAFRPFNTAGPTSESWSSPSYSIRDPSADDGSTQRTATDEECTINPGSS